MYKSNTKGIVIWLVMSFFYAYQYVIRVMPSLIIPDLMAKYNIDASSFGQFSGSYYLGYALMHIPIGIMLDRVGPRIIMPLFISIACLGLVPMLYFDNWHLTVIGRFLVGAGSTSAILGCFKVIRMVFEEEKFSRMLGISVMIGLLGAIYGGKPLNYLINIYGWEIVLEYIMVIGFILAILCFILIPASKEQQESILDDIKDLFKNYRVITICILGGLMVGPLEGFADVWGNQFLQNVYNMDPKIATSLPSLMFIGMCIGSPILSFLADKTKSHYNIIILSAFIMAISFILLLTGKMHTNVIAILFVITGIFSAYQILAIYQATTYVPVNLLGITTASANMIIMAFGYFFHTIIGKVMDASSKDVIYQEGIRIYSADSYIYGIYVIPVCLLLAFFILIFTRKIYNGKK